MKKINKCPKCGSQKIDKGNRYDVDDLCLNCGHVWNTEIEKQFKAEKFQKRLKAFEWYCHLSVAIIESLIGLTFIILLILHIIH